MHLIERHCNFCLSVSEIRYSRFSVEVQVLARFGIVKVASKCMVIAYQLILI